MNDFTNRVSSIAMLALAALPIVALATPSNAATAVKVRDINVLTAQGSATFTDRANVAVLKFCAPERNLSARAACISGARAEIQEKLAVLKTAQLEQASKNLAAR